MGTVELLLELPDEVAAGLLDGTMKRKGGVIYNSTGGVVMWLKETGSSIESQTAGTPLPPQLSAQLQSLQALMGIQIGLQALNLGVTVAGFVILARKMDAIDRKLDQLAGTIGDLTDEISWQQAIRDLERSAELIACLEHAQWAERHGQLQEFPKLRLEFAKSQQKYAMLMRQMLADDRAHADAEAYLSFFRHAAMAGMAKVRCDWLLVGADAALGSHRDLGSTLRSAKDEFLSPIRSFDASRLMRIPASALPGLKGVAAALGEDGNRVSSHGTEIAWCRERGIPFQEWQSIGAETRGNAVVFVRPASGEAWSMPS